MQLTDSRICANTIRRKPAPVYHCLCFQTGTNQSLGLELFTLGASGVRNHIALIMRTKEVSIAAKDRIDRANIT